VDEVMAFRIQGRITDRGKVIRFEQTNTGVPAALGFDAALKSSYVKGRRLESHADFAVGDTVTLVTTFKAYEKFAVNQQGVIRMIAMHSFAVYFVELAYEDAAISKLVVQAHKKERGLMPDQLPHHVACKWLHMKHSDVRPYMCGDFSDEESEPNLSFDLTDLPELSFLFEPETPPGGTLVYTHDFADEESEPNLSFDLTDLPESSLSFEPETPPGGTLLYAHDFSNEEPEPNLSFDLPDLPESPLSFEPEAPPGTLLYTHEEQFVCVQSLA
jgi:hypothetical protein